MTIFRFATDGGGDLCEYECVAKDQQTVVRHTENRPDLVRLDRCQCGMVPTTGRYSNVDAKTHLLARKTSSEAASSNSSSSHDVTQEPITSLHICHHCGYASLTHSVQRVGSTAPGNGTLPRQMGDNSTATWTHSATLPQRQLQSQSRSHSPPPPLLPCEKL